MNFESLGQKLNLKIEELEKNLSSQIGDPISQVKELSLLKEKQSLLKDYLLLQKKIEETKALTDSELKEMAEKELVDLERKTKETKTKLFSKLFEEALDLKNAIVEIHAGTGGDEAEIFASDLLRMYLRYAEREGFRAEILDMVKTPLSGIKEAKILVKGEGAYGNLKYEGGVHRIQRIPSTEKKGRIHTSAAGVIVLPEAEATDLKIKDDEIKIDVFRSSGPGGQSVNTTDSAVRITHLPSSIVVSCQDEKSQHKNKEKALKILRSRLLAQKLEQDQESESVKRKSMVKSLDRSDKIRTYNFPQSRITDHRINLTVHNLAQVLDGDLDEIIQKLKDEEIKQKIESFKI